MCLLYKVEGWDLGVLTSFKMLYRYHPPLARATRAPLLKAEGGAPNHQIRLWRNSTVLSKIPLCYYYITHVCLAHTQSGNLT